MAMVAPIHDFSVLNELGFEREPVAVKFEFFKPEGIEQLDKKLALCEMPRECQNTGKVFYMTAENENCMGKGALGMMDDDPNWAGAGLIGERMGIFKDAGANMRCMTHYTTLNKGGCNFVVFSPISKLTFEPDIIIFTGDITEVGLIERAMTYSTGAPFESKSSAVFQCSWIFTYPFMENKVNYIPMGMGHGTTARKVYKPGEIICTVPSGWFPIVLENLNIMERQPEAWDMTPEEWLVAEEGIYGKIVSDTIEAGLLKTGHSL